MNLDLDLMLALSDKGQWSLDELDFGAPLAGAESPSAAEHREAGLALLLTAGLERLVAHVFRLAAHFADDPRARAIYQLFEADELRHAEAEVRLAKRYGATWHAMPLPTRAALEAMSVDLDRNDRALHEFTAANLVLFELALDAILIPAHELGMRDPLQKEVFERIAHDEARHLAMGYWLLDTKGQVFQAAGREGGLARLVGRRSLGRRMIGRAQLAAGFSVTLMAFAAMKPVAGALHRKVTEPALVRRYLVRVDAIPRHAQAALAHPMFLTGLAAQRHLLRVLLASAGRSPRLAAYG